MTTTMSGPLFSSEKPRYGSTNGCGGDADILARCSTIALVLVIVSLGEDPSRFRELVYYILYHPRDTRHSIQPIRSRAAPISKGVNVAYRTQALPPEAFWGARAAFYAVSNKHFQQHNLGLPCWPKATQEGSPR